MKRVKPLVGLLLMIFSLTLVAGEDHQTKTLLSKELKKGEAIIWNNDYLAKVEKNIDIIFTPTFGGEFHTIERLSPKVVFPMHDGGYEHQYKKFALEAAKRGLKVKICAVTKQGDWFFYSKGSIKKSPGGA